MSVLSAHPALLPAGFRDLMPPMAAQETASAYHLLQLYQRHGYQQVSPPLLEYEDNLLAGSGAALSPYSFRLTDPISGSMMALRADMTGQIARIATTRAVNWPRPLRLCYAGQIIRRVARGEHRPQRQSGQIGLELIGVSAAAADAEIIALACGSLLALGITDFTLDLSLPTLAPSLCAFHQVPESVTTTLLAALDRKDQAAVAAIDSPAVPDLLRLLQLGGRVSEVVQDFSAMALPPQAAQERAHFLSLWELLATQDFAATAMLDLVERRGFEYTTGLGYALYANAQLLELGRGGRYFSKARGSSEPGEPASGFTFYSEMLLAAMPPQQSAKKLYIPFGTSAAAKAKVAAEDFIMIAALTPDTDPKRAAKTQGCDFILGSSGIEAV
jgi:ATP phosphoribosyltransferase regulatory subunit